MLTRRTRRKAALLAVGAGSFVWSGYLVQAEVAVPHHTKDAVPSDSGAEVLNLQASYSTPAESVRRTVARAAGSPKVDDIPAAALTAYQRAANIMNSTDKSCHIDWELIAAVGRVESNHGRFRGGMLDAEGVARPAIYGPVLVGGKFRRVTDTDGGELDRNPRFDRAVGPMQFLPSTWSLARVDADGDAKRNPQDIDDAALAAGVYLCAGREDLRTASGRSAAVFRFNHSRAYVDDVLRVRRAYQLGGGVSPTAYAAVAYHASGPTASGVVRHSGDESGGEGGSPSGAAPGPHSALSPTHAEPPAPPHPAPAPPPPTEPVAPAHATGAEVVTQATTLVTDVVGGLVTLGGSRS